VADNVAAGLEAEKAIEGAARYISNVLAQAEQPGALPATNRYLFAALPIGQATCWMIGPSDSQDPPLMVRFGLADESAKLNLNTATLAMLQYLPRMTPELAAAIVDWRDSNSDVTEGGAESDFYARLNPAYYCKNAPFETVDELRLVNGAYLDILYGEDVNLNGVVDRNENDGEFSPPSDNADGRLDAGLLDYVTVHSRSSTTSTNGEQLINVGAANMTQQLAPILQNAFGAERANAILRQIAPAGGGGGGGGRGGGGGGATPTATFRSVLELFYRSGMNATEFAQIENSLRNPNTNGLVNVNTANEVVLGCIPGIAYDKALALVAHRRSQPTPLTSLAWVKDVLEQESALQAGPYLTGKTSQFTADIAAVGRHGRGYRRIKFIFDVSQGPPRIVHRQDLTHMGWALGPDPFYMQPTFARNLR
jgi:type II secretory pathway component PulK